MAGEIERLLGLANNATYNDEENIVSPPAHPLNGRLISRLETLYLTGLINCGTYGSVVCAKTETEKFPSISQLFLLDNTAEVGSNNVTTVNITIVIGEENNAKSREDHIVSYAENTLVDFKISSDSENNKREIVKTTIRNFEMLDERYLSEDVGVFDDFNSLMDLAEGVSKDSWEVSSMCRDCPIKQLEIR